jgi:hypothetical protein
MATFYLLPSRPFLGQRLSEFLENLFPGMAFLSDDWPDLAERLALAYAHTGVYVVFREDLSHDDDLEETLKQDLGAEGGDEVYEVRMGWQENDLIIHRWNVAEDEPGAWRVAA